MSDIHFDLSKKAEQVTFVLAKKGITNAPTMRVCAALDVSGSMSDEIYDGSLQRAMDQIGGIGIKFDDNGEIDVWTFDTRSYYIGTWTPDDYKTYIKKNNIGPRGGTSYTPFINDIREKMFGSVVSRPREVVTETKGFFGFGKKTKVETVYDTFVEPDSDQTPVLVMVITDGEPSDNYHEIEAALRKTSTIPAFFTFVGVSNQSETFPTIRKLSSNLDNVGFVKLNGFGLSDEQVYEQIITDKLITFLKRF